MSAAAQRSSTEHSACATPGSKEHQTSQGQWPLKQERVLQRKTAYIGTHGVID